MCPANFGRAFFIVSKEGVLACCIDDMMCVVAVFLIFA
jgi:hypothetical protein